MTSALGYPHAQVSFSMTGHVEPVAPCFAVSLSYRCVLCVCMCVARTGIKHRIRGPLCV